MENIFLLDIFLILLVIWLTKESTTFFPQPEKVIIHAFSPFKVVVSSLITLLSDRISICVSYHEFHF